MTTPPGPRTGETVPPPPDPEHEELDGDDEPRSEAEVRGLERILPELIRRGFEVGRAPLERVSESIFPKDIASNIASQLGDLRGGVVKAVAQEVGRFLREADIASEVRKVLTGLDIEAKVSLRFKAREDGTIKPEVDVGFDDDQPEGKPKPSEKRKR